MIRNRNGWTAENHALILNEQWSESKNLWIKAIEGFSSTVTFCMGVFKGLLSIFKLITLSPI